MIVVVVAVVVVVALAVCYQRGSYCVALAAVGNVVSFEGRSCK